MLVVFFRKISNAPPMKSVPKTVGTILESSLVFGSLVLVAFALSLALIVRLSLSFLSSFPGLFENCLS